MEVDYMIVSADSPAALIVKVKALQKKFWNCTGGMIINPSTGEYCQSMVMFDEEEE